MDYIQALNYIHSLSVFGSQPGLERITKLLDALGNPQDSLKFIHVAGTNGKGSACTMLAKCCEKAGIKTGLYTSPYVVDFRERIQLNGSYIPCEDLARLCEIVKNTGITVTEFEFITALAMLWFNEQNCDIVILEVGLGGRYDATNVIKAPCCSVIMKIDYDHTAYLGNTLAKIAGEKCGIIKNGCPTVSYPLQDGEALSVIKSNAEHLTIPDISRLNIISSDIEGNTFVYKDTKYQTRLVGEHQVYNAITVIETLNASGLNISENDMVKGIAEAVIPARLEIISNRPLVILDGAHNPNGANALSDFMKNRKEKIIGISGMMADKNCDEFLRTVMPYCKALVTVTVKENSRSISADELKTMADKYCDDVTTADDYATAIDIAVKKSNNKCPIFVFGSLYLAGAIRESLKSRFNF